MKIKKTWILTDRQLCDCEMILDGSFHPLDRFMTYDDYSSVLKEMRLHSGELFPIPIVLDVCKQFSFNLEIGENIILLNNEGYKVAIMTVESIWEPDFHMEADVIYKTSDLTHPAVNYLFNSSNKIYIGGKIKSIMIPKHHDYQKYRMNPEKVKDKIKNLGWGKVIAFQTRNPLHKAHVEMTLRSMEELDANLLLHPVVGMTKPGDLHHYARVRCYEYVIKKYPSNSAFLAILPLAMRMGGPREALLHSIIRKNYGCTHIIIGRDHAGPGLNKNGNAFYEPYEAQHLVKKYEGEIGIKMIPFQFMVYVPKEKSYMELEYLNSDIKYKTLSGTELRNRLDRGEKIPKWFSYPEVTSELIKSRPPKYKKGFTIFFTGLSGSGKSTLAKVLLAKLSESSYRTMTLLDGDIVRTHLSSELGFSKEHRSLNVRRIGYVAAEITKHGGIAICAPIAPYQFDREFNRNLISQYGGYIEIYVSTNLKKCEERDSKGLYKLARQGRIKEFTGISDPYEIPKKPEIIVNSDGSETPEFLVKKIVGYLYKFEFLK